jgi:hypothetical protein
MNKCAECLGLEANSRDFTKLKCWCKYRGLFVSPSDNACNKFIKGYRTIFEVNELIDDTTYFSLFESFLDLFKPKEEEKKEVIMPSRHEMPHFMSMLLRYAGYDKGDSMYTLFDNIFNNVIYNNDPESFIKALDDEYFTIIHLRISMNYLKLDPKEVAKFLINKKTLPMREAYLNNNYSLTYKEWLIFIKFIYGVFGIGHYMNEDTKNMVLNKFKKVR